MALAENSLVNKKMNEILAEVELPCDTRTLNQIKKDIFEEWCRNQRDVEPGPNGKMPKFTIADFEASLDKLDRIEILDQLETCAKSLSADCPKLSSILDQITGGDLENPFCGILKDLADKSTLVRYSWDCDNSFISPNSQGEFPPAQTTPIPEFNQISVYFGSDICNKSCADILSKVIHETIHAKIFSLVFDNLINKYPEASSFTKEEFRSTYEDLKKW